ncbi:uncharacterized protein AAES06_005954 [Glossophaga mutica]
MPREGGGWWVARGGTGLAESRARAGGSPRSPAASLRGALWFRNPHDSFSLRDSPRLRWERGWRGGGPGDKPNPPSPGLLPRASLVLERGDGFPKCSAPPLPSPGTVASAPWADTPGPSRALQAARPGGPSCRQPACPPEGEEVLTETRVPWRRGNGLSVGGGHSGLEVSLGRQQHTWATPVTFRARWPDPLLALSLLQVQGRQLQATRKPVASLARIVGSEVGIIPDGNLGTSPHDHRAFSVAVKKSPADETLDFSCVTCSLSLGQLRRCLFFVPSVLKLFPGVSCGLRFRPPRWAPGGTRALGIDVLWVQEMFLNCF